MSERFLDAAVDLLIFGAGLAFLLITAGSLCRVIEEMMDIFIR